MSAQLWDILGPLILPVELLIAAFLYLSQLQHREHFLLRAGLGGFGVLVLPASLLRLTFAVLPEAYANGLMTSLTYSIFSYLAIFGFMELCGPSPWQEALYGATCAYLTQHFAYCFHRFLFPVALDDVASGYNLGYLLSYAATYTAAYYLFARQLSVEGQYQVKQAYSLGTTVSALSIALVLSAVAQQLRAIDGALYPVCLLYAMVCCFFVLWTQVGQQKRLALQHKLDIQEQLWLQHKAQYEMSAENVELINRKCHDLKHQIAALKRISDQGQREKSIQELEQSVMIYDAMVETGNEILDTVLTEKSLICEARGITLTCVVDGDCLSFMDAVDIYAIFGNALDNAIEAVSALEDPDRRSIAAACQRTRVFSQRKPGFFYKIGWKT